MSLVQSIDNVCTYVLVVIQDIFVSTQYQFSFVYTVAMFTICGRVPEWFTH